MQKFLIAVVGLVLMLASVYGAPPSGGLKFNAYTTNTTAQADAHVATVVAGSTNLSTTNITFWGINGDAPAVTIRAPGVEPQWIWTPNALIGYDGGVQALSFSSTGDGNLAGDLFAHGIYDTSATRTRVNSARAVASSNIWDASSIRFWGATGDGVTDDLPALRTMMLSQTNIIVPIGTYGFSEPLEITNQVTLSMAAGASFKYIGATNIPYLLRIKGNGSSQNARVTLDGLKLDGGGVLVSNLLEIQNLSYSKLGTVYARNCYGSGIVMADSYANSISPIVTPGIEGSFSSIPSCGLRLIRTVALTVNDPKIEFVTNGISIEHAYETAIYGGTVEYCKSNGVRITDSSALVRLEQVHMEQNTTNDVYVDYAYKVTISGGWYADAITFDHTGQNNLENCQVNQVFLTPNATRTLFLNADISGGTNGYIIDQGYDSTYFATSTTNGVVTNYVTGTLGAGTVKAGTVNVSGDLLLSDLGRLYYNAGTLHTPQPIVTEDGFYGAAAIVNYGSITSLVSSIGVFTNRVSIATTNTASSFNVGGDAIFEAAINAGGGIYDSSGTRTRVNSARAVASSNIWDSSNVKYWGAAGDISTDDTAAIQSAVDAATNGGVVNLPGGTFRLGGTIYVSNSITFAGDNHFKSILFKTNAGYAFQIGSGTSNVVPGIIVRNLKILGGPGASGGVLVSGTYGATLDTLHVTNFPNGYGLHYSDYNYIGEIHHCDLKGNEVGLRVTKSQSDQAAQSFNAMTIDGQGEIQFNQWGVLIGSTNATDLDPVIGIGVTFAGVTVEGNLQGGLWDCGDRKLVIQNCYFENNGGTNCPDIRIGSQGSANLPVGVTIKNNTFTASGLCVDLQKVLTCEVAGNSVNSAYQFLNIYNAAENNVHDNWFNPLTVTVEKAGSGSVSGVGDASSYTKFNGEGLETYGVTSRRGLSRFTAPNATLVHRWDNSASGTNHMNWGVSLEYGNYGDWNLLYSSTGSTGTPDTVALTVDRDGTVRTRGTNMVQRWDTTGVGTNRMNWGVWLDYVNLGDWNLLYSSTGSTGTPDTVALNVDRAGNVAALHGLASGSNLTQLTGDNGIIRFGAYGYPAGPTNYFSGTLIVNTNPPTTDYSTFDLATQKRVSTGSTTANGVINTGDGWAGTTNSSAPSDAATIKAWVNYTNTTGGVFKMPLYQ